MPFYQKIHIKLNNTPCGVKGYYFKEFQYSIIDHKYWKNENHNRVLTSVVSNPFLKVQSSGSLFKILKKRIICSLSALFFPQLILTRSPQISGQNKSEAREPAGLVKIPYGFVTSSLFKRAGNSNEEIF